MTWQVQFQLARMLIDDREREADRSRLARVAAGDDRNHGESASVGFIRRAGARVALGAGRAAVRLASALDAEATRLA
jgi:hypothetical protein